MIASKLGKKKGNSDSKIDKELIQKISNMNLTDMKVYINDRLSNFVVSGDGLNEIIKKLLVVNEKTSKRYIEADDMDSKKKKGFDLVLAILTNKKVTFTAIEQAEQFIHIYKEIIENYDKTYKDIYLSRLKDAIETAVANISLKAEINNRLKVIGS